MLSGCCIFSNIHFLQKHRHKHRNHEHVSILPEILGIDQVATGNPVRKLLLEGIERCVRLIAGRLYFNGAYLAAP